MNLVKYFNGTNFHQLIKEMLYQIGLNLEMCISIFIALHPDKFRSLLRNKVKMKIKS
jgi:hypothetical protein